MVREDESAGGQMISKMGPPECEICGLIADREDTVVEALVPRACGWTGGWHNRHYNSGRLGRFSRHLLYLSAAISPATSAALKMEVPATITFAPASREARAVATLIPPSTSM